MDISNKSLESWIDVAQEAYETSYEKWKETLGITDTSTDSDKSKFHKKVFTDVYKSLSKYAGDQDTSNPQVQFGFNTAIQYIRDISNTNPEINALANRKVLAQLQAMDTNNENRDQANTRLAWKVAFTSILFAFAVAGCSYLLTTFISAGNNKDK